MAIVAAACWIAAAMLILTNLPGDGVGAEAIRATHRAATLLLAAGGILAAVAGLDARRTWRMDDARLAQIRAETFKLAMRVSMPIGSATARAAEVPEVAETPPRGMRSSLN